MKYFNKTEAPQTVVALEKFNPFVKRFVEKFANADIYGMTTSESKPYIDNLSTNGRTHISQIIINSSNGCFGLSLTEHNKNVEVFEIISENYTDFLENTTLDTQTFNDIKAFIDNL